ncbi:zinc-binding dehydrogenase [Tabrizicola sp. TH137]|uniref:NADPH:quinone oxidoreductase family protein n=1 Tax=Tabrizicola sp. TH137 TaxID=2067452 RepID=UPI000C7D6478|nr:NADPH:quinone oxidoreductase family protein [Tabrizicola sp. TH137]PLL12594.1 zinc-binding dehydrogenase [Tabrizicola sp. TH137]
MRAWQIEVLGQPARLLDLPDPQPGPGEALVAIHACGLNFADLLMAEGKYQDKPALPFIPGLELAGTVLALGPGTAGPPPGTRVAVYAGHGGLAERGCFPVESLLPLPDSLPFAEAAGFQIAYGTSHLALSHKARLQPGETLLVLGAAGGVGLTAVEIGHLMGARVIACARGAEKCAIARAAGADEVIDSDTPDLKAALKALGGVDVVYDPVGGPAFDAALRATRPDGRLLAIGFASGSVPQVPANLLLVKNLTVIGFWWGGYLAVAPHLLRDSLATLLLWQAEGRLKPHVSHRLPFEALPQGLDLLRSRAATGKVVIDITPETAR